MPTPSPTSAMPSIPPTPSPSQTPTFTPTRQPNLTPFPTGVLGSTCLQVQEYFNDTDDSVRDTYAQGPVYLLSPSAAADDDLPADPYLAYCDMSTDGGGWQLLLTLTDEQDQYTGSVSPFLNDLNATKPSVTNPYSRDWTGIVDPTSGDQI